MASRHREDLDRHRCGIFEHARQVADHTTGPVSQGQLDRPVQLVHAIAEPAGNLNDHYLTYRVLPGRT